MVTEILILLLFLILLSDWLRSSCFRFNFWWPNFDFVLNFWFSVFCCWWILFSNYLWLWLNDSCYCVSLSWWRFDFSGLINRTLLVLSFLLELCHFVFFNWFWLNYCFISYNFSSSWLLLWRWFSCEWLMDCCSSHIWRKFASFLNWIPFRECLSLLLFNRLKTFSGTSCSMCYWLIPIWASSPCVFFSFLFEWISLLWSLNWLFSEMLFLRRSMMSDFNSRIYFISIWLWNKLLFFMTCNILICK